MAAHAEALPLAVLLRQRSTGEGCADRLLTFVDVDDTGAQRIEYRSYQQLWQRGQALAHALKAEGMGEGDRLGLMMQNHPEFVDAIIACAILGIVFVPIDPRTMGRKLQYMLEATGCTGVIAGDYCQSQLAEVAGNLPGLHFLWVVGKAASIAGGSVRVASIADLPQDMERPLDIAGNRPDMVMELLFTSGSTGDPKAIVITYGRYARSSAHRAGHFGIRASDRMYTGLSLTHANALNISLGVSLYSGIPLVISRKFTKSRLWQLIREHQCTTLNLLGGMFTTIHAEPRRPDDADNPLRLIIGAGMPKPLWREFETRFGVEVLEFYGAAEGGLMYNRPGEGPVGSIGKPAPQHTAMVIDQQGRECPPNVKGEIVFGNSDGSPIQVEYYRNPDASARKTAGGLLRMGDIGYRDSEGWFYFSYRDGSSLRRNGDFISPSLIEKELGEHPDIADVFVYGVPSSNGVAGETDTVAAIVLAGGAQFSPDALWNYCRERLEKNHIPSYLQRVDSIPKTSSEKPLLHVIAHSFDACDPNVVAFHRYVGGAGPQ
ncbi:AMP-binding protein [Bordetella bronchiseptica]